MKKELTQKAKEQEKTGEISHTTEFLGLRLNELKDYDEEEFYKEV